MPVKLKNVEIRKDMHEKLCRVFDDKRVHEAHDKINQNKNANVRESQPNRFKRENWKLWLNF